MGSAPAPGDASPAGSTAGLGATLAIAMAAGPLTVFAVSALSPVITSDLGLSRLQFGLLATASFAAATPAAFVSGRLVDRCRPRRALLMLFAGSAAALLLASAAPNYAWLVAAMATAGVAMSMSNPVTNQIIAIGVPCGARGGMMGLKQSGVQLGQLAAGVSVPALAIRFGWRPALASLLVVVLIGVVSCWRFIPDAGRTSVSVAGSTHRPASPPAVWTLLTYTFLTGAALQATNAYLPLFAFESLSFTPSAAGLTLGVIGATGLVGRIFWGRLTDRSSRPDRVLLWMSLSGAASAGMLLSTSGGGPVWIIWAAAALCGSTVVAANVVVMTLLLRLVQPAAVGSASGLLAVGLYAGFTAGPAGFGVLADLVGYSGAWGAAGAAYLCGAVVLLLRSTTSP